MSDVEDRIARAEGWASEQEREDVVSGAVPMPNVIIDCRSIVGNTPLFWMPNGAGYGSVISEIGRYATPPSQRETDYVVPLALAVECARPRVDIQLLNQVLEREGLKPPLMGWGHPPRCVDCERKANPRGRRR